jgi:hypothetical protein
MLGYWLIVHFFVLWKLLVTCRSESLSLVLGIKSVIYWPYCCLCTVSTVFLYLFSYY